MGDSRLSEQCRGEGVRESSDSKGQGRHYFLPQGIRDSESVLLISPSAGHEGQEGTENSLVW